MKTNSSKLIIAILIINSFLVNSFAFDRDFEEPKQKQSNQKETEVMEFNSDHLEQFFYKKGLKDGAEKGYKDGFRDGLRFAKKQLRLYAEKIKAYEAGKYLKEYQGKITNPEIYQIKNGREIKVLVRGCSIQKELSADEIIDLPLYPIDGNGNYKFRYYNIDESAQNIFAKDTEPTDSADIVVRDSMGYFGNRPSSPFGAKPSYFYVDNTREMRKKLDVLNYTYAIEGNKIKILFSNKQERNEFIEKMGF